MSPRRSTDLVARVNDMVEQFVTRYRVADEIGYGVSITVVPDHVPGDFVPVMVVVLHLTSPLPELDGMYVNLISMDLYPEITEVDRSVQSGIELLRDKAAALLAQSNGGHVHGSDSDESTT